MAERKYFGTDGIRGVANTHPLTPDFAVGLGRAAASVLAKAGSSGQRTRAVIGRDTRLSGPMLESALAAGINSAGGDVDLIGVIPTPGVALNCRRVGADFGVVISASHNPAADNGIKFFAGDGYKLPDATELEIERAVDDGGPRVGGTEVGTTRTSTEDARSAYLRSVLDSVQGLDLSGMKIVVDAAHGAATGLTSHAIRTLGGECHEIGSAPDGININEACGCTHPKAIEEAVKATGSHVGVAHDGDADRILLVDETGSALDGDELLAIAARHHLSKGTLANKTLVATVMSNFGLEACLKELGGSVQRTGVGDRYVIEAMRSGGFNLGGEQSGHVIFHDHTTTGDGVISALQLLAIVRETGQPLSQLRKCLRKFPQVQRALSVTSKPDFASVPAIAEAQAKADAALAGAGRLLLRYSGTEPKLRILLEGQDPAQLEALCIDLESAIKSTIG